MLPPRRVLVVSRFSAVVLSLLTGARAQTLMDPTAPQGAKLVEIFEADQAGKTTDGGPLKCEVVHLKPTLNFAFRYQAGFRVGVPLKQLGADNRTLFIAFRIKAEPSPDLPEPPKPSYFLQVIPIGKLPPQALNPKSKFQGVFDGGFFLGPGSYQVDWVMQDSRTRACRSSWKVEHQPKKDDTAKGLLAAGQVTSLRVNRFAGIENRDSRPLKIAILLHAAPQYPRKSVMSGFDVSMLVSSLTSLLEDTPFTETSVTVFSLQKQREVFRAEKLNRTTLRELTRSLDKIENATVDWSVLKNPKGQAKLLADLVNREIAAAAPPDAVVIMGPNSWNSVKIGPGTLEKSSLSPPIFYVRHDFFPLMFPFRDTIEELTRSAGGKVLTVRGPKDLAEALRKIEAQLMARGKPAAAVQAQ